MDRKLGGFNAVAVSSSTTQPTLNDLVSEALKIRGGILYEIRKYVGNWCDVEDVFQTSLLRLVENFHRYDPKQKFITWFSTIARNTAFNTINQRRTNLNTALEYRDHVSSVGPRGMHFDETGSEDSGAEYRYINDAVCRLSSQSQRDAIVLHYWGGFSLREIGKMLGCKEGQVRKTFYRARESLRKILTEEVSNP